MTFNLPLAQIDAAQLKALKVDGIREGRQLEYKETLPGNSDEDKREFLSDVTSFANAAGGDLIFGVRERRDVGKPTGEIEAIVGLEGLNVDAEQLRLEAMILGGVAPRFRRSVFMRFVARAILLVFCSGYHEVGLGFTWSPTRALTDLFPKLRREIPT